MDLDHDPRVGKAGRYRYCRRCGCCFRNAFDASFHFGDKKFKGGGSKGAEYAKIHCSGIPTGHPVANEAPGSKADNLWEQESGRYLPDSIAQ